jgi:hypothetical protein
MAILLRMIKTGGESQLFLGIGRAASGERRIALVARRWLRNGSSFDLPSEPALTKKKSWKWPTKKFQIEISTEMC